MGPKLWLICSVLHGEIDMLTLYELKGVIRSHIFSLIVESSAHYNGQPWNTFLYLFFAELIKFIEHVNIPSFNIFLQRRFITLIFKYSR